MSAERNEMKGPVGLFFRKSKCEVSLYFLLNHKCKLHYEHFRPEFEKTWSHCALISTFLLFFAFDLKCVLLILWYFRVRNGIKWGLRSFSAQMDLMFTHLSISWVVCSLRYPVRWRDVLKSSGTTSEPGKCTVFRRGLFRSEITCQFHCL